MPVRRCLTIALLAALCLATTTPGIAGDAAPALTARTLYSNFANSPIDPYATTGGWAVSGDRTDAPQAMATSFVPTSSGRMKSLALALVRLGGMSTDTLATLHADDDGVPGPLLLRIPVHDIRADNGFCCSVELRAALPGEGAALVAGTRYWVVLQATGGSDLQALWLLNRRGSIAPSAIRDASGTWTPQPLEAPAFAVYTRAE